MMLKQARNYGCGCVFGNQEMIRNRDAIANMSTRIIMKMTDRDGISALRQMYGFDDEQVMFIREMPEGNALVCLPGVSPFMIQIPDLADPKL